MANEIIDINAAARILKRSARHVRALCGAGRIKGARNVGGTWVILADVDRNGKITIAVAPSIKVDSRHD
jgi:hypothetical protein